MAEVPWQLLLRYTTDAIGVLDAQGNLRYVSPNLEAITGRTPEEALGRSPLEHIHPDDVAGVQRAMQRIMARPGAQERVEYRLLRADGKPLFVEAVGVNLLDHPDVQGLVINLRDVSRRAAAEQAVEQQRQSLARIGQIVRDCIWLVSIDQGRSLYVSDAYQDVFGRPPARFMADPWDWLEAVHPEDRDRVDPRKGEASGLVTYRVVHPDGQVRWVRSSIHLRDGQAAGVATDVTGLKQTEEELRRLGQELAKRDAERVQAINTIAHELASPLNPVAVHLAMIKQNVADGLPPPERSVPMIEKSVARLVHLIDDLRDLARLDAGAIRLEPERFDLAEVAGFVRDSLAERAEAQDVAVALDVPRIEVVADPRRIVQVLTNLVGNAIKFSRGGTVRVRAWHDQGIRVEVADTGRGLAADEIPRLFQAFSQVHAPGESPERGTGLGLYICKGLVEAHGGEVWVRSEGLGKGSVFGFRVP